jgi:hypothetical protein
MSVLGKGGPTTPPFIHDHDPAPEVVQYASGERAEGVIYPVLVAHSRQRHAGVTGHGLLPSPRDELG